MGLKVFSKEKGWTLLMKEQGCLRLLYMIETRPSLERIAWMAAARCGSTSTVAVAL